MNTTENTTEVSTCTLKEATTHLKQMGFTDAKASKSPRDKGVKEHQAVKIKSTPDSKMIIESMLADNPSLEGYSFFTSRDGGTHGIFRIVTI